MRVIYQSNDWAIGDETWATGMPCDRKNQGGLTWAEAHFWYPTRKEAEADRQYYLKSGWARKARVVSDEEYDRLCAEGVIRDPRPLPQKPESEAP